MEKLTKDYLDSLVVQTNYIHNDLLTICILTLKNGFKVIGQSSCISADNYNTIIGETVAYQNAFSQLWTLEGYLLKQRLYEEKIGLVTLRNGRKCKIVHESPFGKLLTVCIDDDSDELPETHWHNADGSFYADNTSHLDIIDL